MKRVPRNLARVLIAAGILILVAAVVAPFTPAEWIGEPVGAALAEALDRQVEIRGPVRWRVFGGLGLTFGDVVIHDDPSMGLEPLAYVDSLEVGFALSSLWRGRLAFSHLRLVEPSVNLVKNTEGVWNYPGLLDRAFDGSQRGRVLPRIQVRSGRLNFKHGDTKSVFCFTGADLDIRPDESDDEAVIVQFEGKPARTDRPAQSFGEVSGGGWLYHPGEDESRIRWNLRMQRSSISELLTLMTGQRVGLEGFVTSSAQLEGPLSDVEIAGQFQLAEFNQGFLLPAEPEPVMYFRGRLDVPGQRLQLSTVSGDESVLPLAIEVRASDYLVQPDWQFVFLPQRLPIETVMPVALDMGFAMSAFAGWRGFLSGAVEWSRSDGFRGLLSVEDAELREGGVPLRVDTAELSLAGNSFEMPETTVRIGTEETIRAEASYEGMSEEWRVALTSEDIAVGDQAEIWRRLTGSEPPALLDRFEGGSLSGKLTMLRPPVGETLWSGEVELRGAQLSIDGISDEIEVESARVLLTDDGFRVPEMQGSVGGLAIEARYERSGSAERPHRLELKIDEADAFELGELFGPSLERSRPGLIARTFGLGVMQPPGWLTSRRASGSLRIDRLSAGLMEFSGLEFDFYWDGTRIELVNLRSGIGRATIEGSASVNLGTASPTYLVRAAIEDFPWSGGLVDAEGRLRSSGTWLEVVTSASAEGSFLARSVVTEGGELLREVSGCYELRPSGTEPRLLLPCVRLRRQSETYDGWGEGDLTGPIELDLFSGERPARGTARLAPFDIELNPRETPRRMSATDER